MKKKAAKKRCVPTPRTATTEKDILLLPSEVLETASHWIIVDEKCVTIYAQRFGELASSRVEMPRRTFNKFVDWYNGTTRT